MIATQQTMQEKAAWRGAWQILRYNRGMYLAAAAILVGGACQWWLMAVPWKLQLVILMGLVLTLFWSVSSLWVSHLVYDRTLPMRWKWLIGQGPASVRRWLQIHAGVDEAQGDFHRLSSGEGVILDVFDPVEMTEPSIRRARALQRAPVASPADYRALSVPSESIDVVYLIFAAHELRRPASREQLFRELVRVLRPGGRVILLEHCRGLGSAIVFGPGALHFFSRQEWLRVAHSSGLRFVGRTPVTSFADTFVWEKQR